MQLTNACSEEIYARLSQTIAQRENQYKMGQYCRWLLDKPEKQLSLNLSMSRSEDVSPLEVSFEGQRPEDSNLKALKRGQACIICR